MIEKQKRRHERELSKYELDGEQWGVVKRRLLAVPAPDDALLDISYDSGNWTIVWHETETDEEAIARVAAETDRKAQQELAEFQTYERLRKKFEK
jgi:hypothetical protein